MTYFLRWGLRLVVGTLLLQQHSALPACMDWIVLKMGNEAHTWLEYAYWYGARYRWDPAAAWRAYLEEDTRWHQFVLDMATLHRLMDMGLERPTPREIEQAVLSVQGHFPADADAQLLRSTVQALVQIRNYRDRVFRYTLTIPPEEIRRRYEARREQTPQITLDEVYADLQREIWEERRDELFRAWQEEQLQQYPEQRMPPPPECLPDRSG